MSKHDKIRVAVLYGGRSGEHEVSLVSATNVIQHLDRNKFDVIPIGIDKKGAWFLGDDVFKKELPASKKMLRLQRDEERLLFNPDFIGKQFPQIEPTQLPKLKQTERLFDVVFPAIHGTLCEDGAVQGMLELADIPYVGCGILASAVGMDKDVSKRLIMNAGVPVPGFLTLKYGQWLQKETESCEAITKQLGYPVFVKPANTGSSVGVHKVKSEAELIAAIDDAFRYDLKVIVEKAINAIELEIAVLESEHYGAEPIVSVVGEVRPNHHEFYSYSAKYLDEEGAELIIPTAVSSDIQENARLIAKKVFTALDCEGMCRVDLFLERETNRIYFNEINSIPGFTQISMYPKLMTASGINYTDLLTRLVTVAIDRHTRKGRLSREFVINQKMPA